MTLTELGKMKMAQLIDLAQVNGIFIWRDSTRSDVYTALKAKLINGDSTIWCC